MMKRSWGGVITGAFLGGGERDLNKFSVCVCVCVLELFCWLVGRIPLEMKGGLFA